MITLHDSLGNGWQYIKSRRDLNFTLCCAVERLIELGEAKRAKEWGRRLHKMPRFMDKDAINCVLLAACLELEKAGLMDSHGNETPQNRSDCPSPAPEFTLSREPKPKKRRQEKPEKQVQTVMFSGMGCLAGQLDLFETDGGAE